MAGRRLSAIRVLAGGLLIATASLAYLLLTAGAASADEPATGSITITMNQALNQEDQDFEFTGCLGAGCGTFLLNPADENGSTPRTTTGTGLAPGTYTVTQNAIPHWSLKSLTCDTGETVNLAERRATIVLTAGEDVHCTFTTQTQSISIGLDTMPDSALDFDFTGCAGTDCGPFTLDDDDDPTLERSIEAVGLAPGTYIITQAADAPLPLASISCNSGKNVDLGARRLTVTVSPNERVSCMFRNQAPGITIIQDSVPDDDHDVVFTGCLGTGCAEFLLDDDADPTVPRSIAGEGMAAGTYTVTQSADPDWPLTSITCTTGESVDLDSRTVTIALGAAERTSCTFKNTSATLTLAEDTTPDGPQDFTLQRCDGETCVDVTLDDDFDSTHPTSTGKVPLPPGTYTVTAPEVDGFELTSLRCTTSEAVDLDARRVTITLSASEQQTCTFGHRPIPPPLTEVAQITTNVTGSCARLTNGQARCWGDNEFGRLGDGSVSSSSVPAVVSDTTGADPLTGVSDLSAGFSHTCAVLETGQARCWGYGPRGSLGDGTSDDSARTRPTMVFDESGTGPLTSVSTIVAAGNHTCALLTTGQARCWGDAGVVGDGTAVMRPLPVAVQNPEGTGPLTGITQISARLGHTCALLDSREAVCWGSNNAGQLGDGTTTARTRPVVVSDPTGTGPLTGIARIEVGYVNTCALLDSGEARCWGQNTHGELGDGTTTGRSRPVPVLDPSGTAPLAGIDAISAGMTNCAHRENGETYCWGRAFDGGQAQTLPVLRTNGTGDGPLTDVAALTSGDQVNCALLTNGQVRCWGYSWGRLGDGTSVSRARPVPVIDPRSVLQPLTGVGQLSTGRTHSCAVLVSGEARCWGEGRALGNPDVTRSNVAVSVRDVDGSGPLTDVTQISAGTGHTCAVLTNHEARCWGKDSIGDGTSSARPLPTVVLDEDGSAPLSDVSHIEAGTGGTCAVLANTEARCWGPDQGDLPAVVIDVDGVGPLSGVVDVAINFDAAYAALADGRLVRWEGPQPPVPVVDPGTGTAFEDIVAVAAGGAEVCVTRTNGQVGCLGEVSNPEGTGPITDVVDVESSDTHSCATLSTGEARCWGANNGFGELGVPPPTTSPHSIVVHDPAADGPLLGARTIETGLFSTCVLFDHGAVKCWGLNNAGALGDGTEVASRFEPVAVLEPAVP